MLGPVNDLVFRDYTMTPTYLTAEKPPKEKEIGFLNISAIKPEYLIYFQDTKDISVYLIPIEGFYLCHQ